MVDQYDARFAGSERGEFKRLVQGHVSDIRALAIFYGRQGCNPNELEDCLIEAAETIREVAHSVPLPQAAN